jgi:hypothetical protein
MGPSLLLPPELLPHPQPDKSDDGQQYEQVYESIRTGHRRTPRTPAQDNFPEIAPVPATVSASPTRDPTDYRSTWTRSQRDKPSCGGTIPHNGTSRARCYVRVLQMCSTIMTMMTPTRMMRSVRVSGPFICRILRLPQRQTTFLRLRRFPTTCPGDHGDRLFRLCRRMAGRHVRHIIGVAPSTDLFHMLGCELAS